MRTIKKCSFRKKHGLSGACEIFYKLPFPCFYPPQLEKRKIIICKNLKVKKVEDIIVYGQITDCDSGEPIVGAIVKAFEEDGTGISHTFSGCDGLYMLRIPFALAGETITITGALTNLEQLEPCECSGNKENDKIVLSVQE